MLSSTSQTQTTTATARGSGNKVLMKTWILRKCANLTGSVPKRLLVAMSGTWQLVEKLPTSVRTGWYPWRDARGLLSSCPPLTSWSILSQILQRFITNFRMGIRSWQQLLMALIQSEIFTRQSSTWSLSQVWPLLSLVTSSDLITQDIHVSGQPMQAHKRIQISVPVLPSQRFDILNNVAEVTIYFIRRYRVWKLRSPKISSQQDHSWAPKALDTTLYYNINILYNGIIQNVFPLVWVDEGADIDSDPDLVKEAKGFLVTPFVAVDAVMGVRIHKYM